MRRRTGTLTSSPSRRSSTSPVNPNPHVGFGGGGIHHCLGGQLARQQLAALFDELLHRLPDIEVCGEPSYTVNTFFHGVNHLPVRFTPSR